MYFPSLFGTSDVTVADATPLNTGMDYSTKECDQDVASEDSNGNANTSIVLQADENGLLLAR